MNVVRRFTSWALLALSTGELTQAGEAALSDAEADAIVAVQVEATRQSKDARLAALEKNRALSRKVLNKGGRRVVVERVVPPPIPEAKIAAGEPWQPTAEQLATAQRRAAKDHVALMLSATVYDREVTELRWTIDGARGIAFSNVDFTLLRSVHDIETPRRVFSIFMGIGESDRRMRLGDPPGRRRLPAAESFLGGPGTYRVAEWGGTDAEKEVLAGLDALHRHYLENEAELRVKDQRRRAIRSAWDRYRAANPPEPEDTLIQLWEKPSTRKGGRK